LNSSIPPDKNVRKISLSPQLADRQEVEVMGLGWFHLLIECTSSWRPRTEQRVGVATPLPGIFIGNRVAARLINAMKRNRITWLLIASALTLLATPRVRLLAESPVPTPPAPARSFPSVAQLPPRREFPDPLVMLDGRRVTTPEQWLTERRPELIALFQHYMYGFLPPAPKQVRGKLEREDPRAFGGKATLKEVTVTFGPPGLPLIHLMVIVPNRRTGPAPVVLSLNYFGNHTLVRDRAVALSNAWMPARGEGVVDGRATEASRGTWVDRWDIERIIDRGYSVATFYNGDIDPDRPDARGLQTHFPQVDFGTIAAWAWGLSRAVDYLVTDRDLDRHRIVVTGHSRLGKAALLAAALDQRIALAIPHQAGAGGSAPSRAKIAYDKPWNTLDTPQTKRNETVADLNEKFPHWFNAAFKEFNAQPERLPFDQHCLVALCAPRPVLFTNGRADTWINPAGQFEVLRAAAPVYRLLGAGDFTAETLPPDGQLSDGVLGYYLRPGAHSLLPEDWKVFLDFADKHLGRPGGTKPAAKPDQKDVGVAGDHNPATPITIDPDYPHSFRYQAGERFFPMGDTAYFLIAQPTDVIAHYIDVRRAHNFNFVRMMAMAEGFWPFGGTPSKPQYTVINESVMRKLDWVFDYAAARGMNVELIIWGYGVAGGEGLWASPRDQDFWISTLVNRYKGRQNLFMFTVANEFERYPDGKYQFDPADVEWARGVAARIRELDLTHPIGCHPSVWITDQDPPNKGPRPFASYKGFTQRPPPVVWPLWEGSAVNVNVTQNNEGMQPRSWGNLDARARGLTYHSKSYQGTDYPAKWTASGWEFEAAGLEDCLAEDWAHGKPILNTEFGYQHEPGYESGTSYATRQVHQPATVRKKAWKIATAGAYFAAGFEGTAVRNFTKDDVVNFRPSQLEVLRDFFTGRTQYWKMSPHLELVASHNVLLALPGKEYVAYFPRGGTNSVKLVAGTYGAEWLHAETGRYSRQPDLTVTGGSREFVPPEHPNDDWVLHLRQRD
jgi:dienelactone hydrolase